MNGSTTTGPPAAAPRFSNSSSSPLFAGPAAWGIGCGEIDDALPLKLVQILSAMPKAFNALIPRFIDDLERDLANACWLYTTAALIVALPVLRLVIGSI